MTTHHDARAVRGALLLSGALSASCARAPSFDILGSYFPAWLACVTVALLLTVVVRWLLLRRRIDMEWPVAAYPALVAVFTFTLWLLFFR